MILQYVGQTTELGNLLHNNYTGSTVFSSCRRVQTFQQQQINTDKILQDTTQNIKGDHQENLHCSQLLKQEVL